MLRVYAYSSCDSCRKSLAWLKVHGVPHETIPIRDQPPSVAELKQVLEALGGARRKLCNVSGRDYRESGLGNELDTLSEREFLLRLSQNGNLVKRPLLVGKFVGMAGFSEASWAEKLLA